MERDYLTLKRASASRQLVHQLWPLLFYQFAHRIGNGFDTLELKEVLVCIRSISSGIMTLLSKTRGW